MKKNQKLRFKHWASEQGMTMVEVMIASALILVLLLATFSFSTDLMKQVEAEKDKGEFIIDSNLGLQKIWPTLAAMKPSMNNLDLRDDNNYRFFDYRTDATSALLPESNATQRTFVLDSQRVDAGTANFDFLIDDTLRGTTTLYNPTNAYDPVRLFNNRELVFVGIDQSNYISTRLQPNPPPARPTLEEGSLILFHSPVYLKNPELLQDNNYNVDAYVQQIPRNFAFLGSWGAGVLTKHTLNGLFLDKHPLRPALNIQNVDEYFRYLPPSLAGGTFTAMTPVTAYRLTARKTTIKLTERNEGGVNRYNIDVYLFPYDPNVANFPAAASAALPPMNRMLFKNIKALKLMRDHISSPIVRIEVLQ